MAGKSPKSLERFVADKIASLTDRNALEMHKNTSRAIIFYEYI